MPARPTSALPRKREEAIQAPGIQPTQADQSDTAQPNFEANDEEVYVPRASMEYTTSRQSYKLASNTIGSDTGRRAPKTTAGVSDQGLRMQLSGEARLVYQQRARPYSHRVQAAAYRAYGGLGSRDRPPPRSSSAMPFFNTSTSVIDSIKGRRPSSAILGGGYHYPTSRPHTAHEKSTRRKPQYIRATFEAAPDGPLLSGPHMTNAPALQRPVSAGPIMTSTTNSMFRTSCFQDANGQEQRLSHTLPTDPNAKRVWENLSKRSDFVPPTAMDHGHGSCSLPLTPHSTMHRRLPRPLSGHSVRLSSAPVLQQHQLMSNNVPRTVSGYSAPEVELAVPSAQDVWWQSCRLGKTAIQALDTKLKMAAAGTMPVSENQRARAARGVQLSPLKAFQPAPHTLPVEVDGQAPDGCQNGDGSDQEGVQGAEGVAVGYDCERQQGPEQNMHVESERMAQVVEHGRGEGSSACLRVEAQEIHPTNQPGDLSNYV